MITREMRALGNTRLAAAQQGFYQTQPGGYGAGDKFLGIRVPLSRSVATEHQGLAISEIRKLAQSPFHEIRFVALVIVVTQFKKAKDQRVRTALFNLYLSMVRQGGTVNNWDLVDASAPYMGAYLIDQPDHMSLLLKMAKNKDLWVQRTAMIFTFAFIREGDNKPTLVLAQEFLDHPHDLMHKAAGWMLREVGKKRQADLVAFLRKNSSAMPRTMLRYSIEKFPEGARKKWLANS